jgi:hypothetical protein
MSYSNLLRRAAGRIFVRKALCEARFDARIGFEVQAQRQA